MNDTEIISHEPVAEDLQNTEIKLDPELEKKRLDAEKHAIKMKVAVDDTKAKCVDGGYQEDEAVGALAIPGGHLGVSVSLLRLGFTPQEAFSSVYDHVTSSGGQYDWHTDHHEGHGDCEVGCGHCNAAINQSQFYGVESSLVRDLLQIVRDKQAEVQTDEKKTVDCIVLDREHQEKGILVITSEEYTVKPWDQEDNNQYFIYDIVRHKNFLKKFVEDLNAQGREVDFDKLWKFTEEQTSATLGLLGSSKGKPMYEVDFKDGEPFLKFIDYAPTGAKDLTK
jgi:hypothetical protein